jgi:DedD protein
MGLLSFFKRKPATEMSSAEDVRRARARARQRLIGATVLVAVAVVGLPLLLDTAPRPVAADLPIEVPRKEALAPSAVPPRPTPPASRPLARAELPAEPRDEASAPSAAPTPVPKVAAVEPKLPPKPAVVAAPVVAAKAVVADGRYVVQVGAFAETTGAREARAKVEKLGLKTYTQVVETQDGKRIRVRVGPYAERAEADKAAAQLRASGLAAAVLTL